MLIHIKQVFYHYTKWEDWRNGMWRTICGKEREVLFKKAIKFTGNHKLYGRWMIKVIDEWPISTEVNLTNASINQRAWIGHAACCLAFGCPEDIVRQAWHCLIDKQRYLANMMADIAINQWKTKYMEKRQCPKENSEYLFTMPPKNVSNGRLNILLRYT